MVNGLLLRRLACGSTTTAWICYMKPLTLRKCLTCVHWQWQLRVQEAINLFVSVHLPSSNVSSFVWHDLCCFRFAIKNLRSLRTSSPKQTSFSKPYIQVVFQPSSYRVTFLGIGNSFPKHVLSYRRLCAWPCFLNSCVNSWNRSLMFRCDKKEEPVPAFHLIVQRKNIALPQGKYTNKCNKRVKNGQFV